MQVRQFAREPIPSEFFMPRPRGIAPDPDRLELSVFDIDDLEEHDIWALGWRFRVQVGQRLYSRADFPTDDGADLTFEIDEPPERHRVFHGWPAEEQLQALIAHDLAVAAVFIPRPGGKTGKKESPEQPYPG